MKRGCIPGLRQGTRPFGFPSSNPLLGKERHLLESIIWSRTRNPKGLVSMWDAPVERWMVDETCRDESSRQQELLFICAGCAGETRRRGRLVVTHCIDGRWVLWLKTGRKEGAWLELMPADAVWLAGVLQVDVTAANSQGSQAPRCIQNGLMI